jgi:hypothetical protein
MEKIDDDHSCIGARTLIRLDAPALRSMTIKDVRSLARRLNATPVHIHASSKITYVIKHWRMLPKRELVHAMIHVVEDIKRRLETHETICRDIELEMSSDPAKGTVFYNAENPSFRIVVSHVNRNGSLTCWPILGSKRTAAMVSLRKCADSTASHATPSSYVGQGTTWVRCLSSAAAQANND